MAVCIGFAVVVVAAAVVAAAEVSLLLVPSPHQPSKRLEIVEVNTKKIPN